MTNVNDNNPRKPRKCIHRLLKTMSLQLHTKPAQVLFWGDGARKAIGLLSFAKQMGRLWHAAIKDDPYADACLLQVYQALTEQQQYFSHAIEQHQLRLTEQTPATIQLAPFAAEKPLVKQLTFRTAYGFMAAQLLATVDYALRLLLTAKSVGSCLETVYRDRRHHVISVIEPLFALPFHCPLTGITREDVSGNTERFAEVKSQLSTFTLPPAVLELSTRSPIAPFIRKNHPKTPTTH